MIALRDRPNRSWKEFKLRSIALCPEIAIIVPERRDFFAESSGFFISVFGTLVLLGYFRGFNRISVASMTEPTDLLCRLFPRHMTRPLLTGVTICVILSVFIPGEALCASHYRWAIYQRGLSARGEAMAIPLCLRIPAKRVQCTGTALSSPTSQGFRIDGWNLSSVDDSQLTSYLSVPIRFNSRHSIGLGVTSSGDRDSWQKPNLLAPLCRHRLLVQPDE